MLAFGLKGRELQRKSIDCICVSSTHQMNGLGVKTLLSQSECAGKTTAIPRRTTSLIEITWQGQLRGNRLSLSKQTHCSRKYLENPNSKWIVLLKRSDIYLF